MISLLLSLLLLDGMTTTHAGIPPIPELPKEEVVPAPTIKTMREQETNHDVAEIPIIQPDLFPVRGVDDLSFPSEPFRPSGPDQVSKKEEHIPNPKPCGRWQHTTVVIGGEFLIYGGIANGGSGTLNDVWMYNGADGAWTKLEQNELCSLPVAVNPTLRSSKNGARPPLFPSPPLLRLAPGLNPERILKLKRDQEVVEEKKARQIPIDRMTPVPTQEPIMPTHENFYDDDKKTTTSPITSPFRLRRRRLQSYVRLGIVPEANHANLQTHPRTLNDIWTYSVAKLRWRQPFPIERQPPPRWLHGALSINKKMIIFGGVTNNSMLLNDVWEYNPETNFWSEMGTGTEAMDRPTPREGMSMVKADNDANPLIFGGIGYGYVPYNDVWRFIMKTEIWEMLEIKEDDDAAGAAGASSSSSSSKDSTTTNNYVAPTIPPPRWMHSASTFTGEKGTEMYIFGGCSKDFVPMDDLWKLDVTSKKWMNLMGEKRALRPSGRWLHSSSILPIDEQNGIYAVVVYGGGVNNQPMDDLWVWNTKEKEWEEMEPYTDRPFARAGHTLTSIVKDTVAAEEKVDEDRRRRRRRRRRRLLGMMPEVEGEGGASDLFAMEGPQDKEEVNHETTASINDLSDRRPTTVADEFLFLFGGMSERGLGASSTKGDMGLDFNGE